MLQLEGHSNAHKGAMYGAALASAATCAVLEKRMMLLHNHVTIKLHATVTKTMCHCAQKLVHILL